MISGVLRKNTETLIEWERLDEEGKSPVLAVYRGREFVIIEYQADDLVEKITNFFKSIFYSILSCMGIIDKSEETLRILLGAHQEASNQSIEEAVNEKETFYRHIQGLSIGDQYDYISKMTPEELGAYHAWQRKLIQRERDELLCKK